jgi:predicted RNase H-like HicB family nuclease
MILDLIIEKTNDGFNADVPSLQDCDTWAHDEETAISNILERVTFFLHIDPKLLKLDKARIENNITIYKLIINKPSL